MCAKLIHAALLLQMLVHSIFGCCWHHAHAAEATTCQHQHQATASVEPKGHACRSHLHDRQLSECDDSPSESEPQPHGSPPCDEERCQFAKAEITRIADFEFRWLLSSDWLSSTPFLVQLSKVVGFVSCVNLDHSHLLTPVERCALLQEWLI